MTKRCILYDSRELIAKIAPKEGPRCPSRRKTPAKASESPAQSCTLAQVPADRAPWAWSIYTGAFPTTRFFPRQLLSSCLLFFFFLLAPRLFTHSPSTFIANDLFALRLPRRGRLRRPRAPDGQHHAVPPRLPRARQPRLHQLHPRGL